MEDFRSGIGPTLQQELEKRARACSAVSWDSREAVNWLVRPRSLLAASLCCTVGMWFTHIAALATTWSRKCGGTM